jgi:hypothetical protein
MYTRSSSYEAIESGDMRESAAKSLRKKGGKREIANGLREWINDHPDFDRIPSEMRIAKEWMVSRMTARDAVKILKDEGLVYSENQKTFISDQSERLTGFFFSKENRQEAPEILSKGHRSRERSKFQYKQGRLSLNGPGLPQEPTGMDGLEGDWFAFGSGKPCPKCSQPNRVHMLKGKTVSFCYSCGKRLAHRCESCDGEFIVGNNDRVLFCPSCGTGLPSTDNAPTEDLVKEPA